MSISTAFLDANVLYPAPLRDLLMHLSLVDSVKIKWSEQVHDEWTRNLLKNRPDISEKQLVRTRQLMNDAVEDCLVTGYEALIETLDLPDPNDRHVLAAAITAKADILVSANTKDFPNSILSSFGIELLSADDFIMRLAEKNLDLVLAAFKIQRESLKNPPLNTQEFIQSFEKLLLPKTVLLLQEYQKLI